MRFMTEAKVLPAGVLNRQVNEKANRRKPGKKELCDLTGEPTLDLLPMVFASARQAHERLCQMAQRAGGKPPEPFTKPHGFALRCAPSHTSFKRPPSNAGSWQAGSLFRFRRLKRSLHKLQKSHGSYMPVMNANQ